MNLIVNNFVHVTRDAFMCKCNSKQGNPRTLIRRCNCSDAHFIITKAFINKYLNV